MFENEKSAPVDVQPVVETASGAVRGERASGVDRFLGIPYAQPIAGRNRWAPPQALEPWAGTWDATRYGQLSPQIDLMGGSPVSPAFRAPEYAVPGDECLNLNVWAPAEAGPARPVMVWLHGGGWSSESANGPIYDGHNLAARGDVVLVSVNHRLGASGLTDFSRVLGGDFADSSNLGIRDIVAALEWVRENIAAFGGDSDLVTIFGESGGGWKVATLLGTPAARGLFHRAVIESGPLTRFLTTEQADDLARQMLDELGIAGEDAAKLHELAAEDVVAAEGRVLEGSPMSMQAPGFPTGFWPVIDSDLIPRHVFSPDAAPTSLDVPLLIGQNGTEFTLFMLRDEKAYSLEAAELEQRVAQTFGADAAPRLLASYRRDNSGASPSEIWFRMFSDFAMGVLTSEIMNVRSVPGAAPVFAYRFDWRTPLLDGKLLSPHTMEIPFVFNNVAEATGVLMTGGGEAVEALAATISAAWVSFARTGVPSADALPGWPAYTMEGRQSMHLDETSRVAPYIDSEAAEIFRAQLWRQAGLA